MLEAENRKNFIFMQIDENDVPEDGVETTPAN